MFMATVLQETPSSALITASCTMLSSTVDNAQDIHLYAIYRLSTFENTTDKVSRPRSITYTKVHSTLQLTAKMQLHLNSKHRLHTATCRR